MVTLGTALAIPYQAWACRGKAPTVLLCGDSIFDNDAYVEGPSFFDHFKRLIGRCWDSQKRATDGDKAVNVMSRFKPHDREAAEYIFLSVGGNDALEHRGQLQNVHSVFDLQHALRKPLKTFRANYDSLLKDLSEFKAQVTVCTIYTAIPFGDNKWGAYVPLALTAYNQVIIATAKKYNMDVLHLEKICTEPEDFSSISPIEPSEIGGEKIAKAITQRLLG